MLVDIIILFIIITIICLILSVYTMDDTPMLAIVFVMVGMIFSILVTYGMWDVEFFYVGYNATEGNTTAYMHSITSYGNPYGYIFELMFFIFCILFVKTGINMWRDSLKTKGEMEYKKLKEKK